MNGRERIEAAFSPEGAEHLPAVICYENVFLRDHWSAFTACPWWYLHMPDARLQLAWTRDLVAALGQDWFQMFPWTSLEEEESGAVEVSDQGVFRIDAGTGRREEIRPPRPGGWTAGSLESVPPEDLPASFDAIEAAIPDPAAADVRALRERQSVADALIREFGGALWPYRHVSGPLWKTYGLWGFQGMMIMIASRPDLVHFACEKFLALAMRNVREAADHGAAGVWIEDCFTDMISPEAFANLNAPYVRRLTDAIRASGLRSIYYFCGNPRGKWDCILSLGMDALALEEGKKGFANDIDDIVDRVRGRCVVVGNLDAVGVLQNGDENCLREAIRRQVAAARRNGSRFILSLGSPPTAWTPVERVRLYCDLAHELGAA